MRPLLLGRRNCCVTRPGIGPPRPSEEMCAVCLVICLQFLAYYMILLGLQLINFPRACTISREAPSRFPHCLQPCPVLMHQTFLPGLSSQVLLMQTFIVMMWLLVIILCWSGDSACCFTSNYQIETMTTKRTIHWMHSWQALRMR